MRNQCLQDEGVGCSSGCIRAFVWDFEGVIHWELWELSRNLKNLTQTLSYNRLDFISFQG